MSGDTGCNESRYSGKNGIAEEFSDAHSFPLDGATEGSIEIDDVDISTLGLMKLRNRSGSSLRRIKVSKGLFLATSICLEIAMMRRSDGS